MAASTIDRVREAELKANEARDAAEMKAEQIVADARRQAEELLDAARKSAAELDARAVAEAKIRADAMVGERKADAEERARALTEKTLKLKQNVINKLVRETLV